jgi:diguanylate cyclase (GGDEF)-like protein
MAHAIVIIQIITLVISVAICIATLVNWGHEKIRYLGYLTLAAALFALGYTMEMTSIGFTSAYIATMVTYAGSPYIGICLWLFARDFTGKARLRRFVVPLLFLVAFFFTVNVWIYPHSHLYYLSAWFSTTGTISRLAVTPGILYYPCMVFIYVFCIWGTAIFVADFWRHHQYIRGMIMILACALPLVGQLIKLIMPDVAWNPTSLFLTLGTTFSSLLLLYMASRRVPIWRQEQVQTEFMATHDGLTGLLNHTTFLDRATESFNFEASKSLAAGAALMIDIDLFKDVNDTYGHPVGDVVLKRVAEVITARLRDSDVYGRYGGEEFGVWLPTAGESGAVKVAEQIRHNIGEQIFQEKGQEFSISVSVGVSVFTNSVGELAAGQGAPVKTLAVTASTFPELIGQADVALYKAKAAGRDCVAVYLPGEKATDFKCLSPAQEAVK